MNLHKINFKNSENQNLAGRLEMPNDQKPHNFVIFAHCFTCTKNLLAVTNISRALTKSGFAVLRFDFTGLGESEGDFENTNFSGNVSDLISASKYLEEHYSAPSLLIGHSLGGAAVIMAAEKLENIKAVVTINSPSDPSHVKNSLQKDLNEIVTQGEASVNLVGRNFTIKKQFLDDLEKQPLKEVVKRFKKALLIMHSPQDTTVSIKNAEEIYIAATHPKSFVSLDGANHLLTDKKDSIYVGNVIAAWVTKYLNIEIVENKSNSKKVSASLNAIDGFTTKMQMGRHFSIADEPESFGGNDFGPTPYDLIGGGLAACTAMTIQMYAKRKKWDVKNVEVVVTYSKEHAVDCENCGNEIAKIDTFKRKISFEGQLDEIQTKKLLEIADKCPVHKTLHSKTQIITSLTI